MAESGYVYFIYDPDVPAVKIGKAKDVDRRMKTFLTANYNLQLIGVLPGYTRLEKELHDRFAWARIYGEWFHPVPKIMEIAIRSAYQPLDKPPRKEARRPSSKRQASPSGSSVTTFIAILLAAWSIFVILSMI